MCRATPVPSGRGPVGAILFTRRGPFTQLRIWPWPREGGPHPVDAVPARLSLHRDREPASVSGAWVHVVISAFGQRLGVLESLL